MKHWLGGVAAVLFGLAALVGAGGYVIGNLPSAEAQDFGPVVAIGENPLWSSSASLNATNTLITLPSEHPDQLQVITDLLVSVQSSDPENCAGSVGVSLTHSAFSGLLAKAVVGVNGWATNETGGCQVCTGTGFMYSQSWAHEKNFGPPTQHIAFQSGVVIPQGVTLEMAMQYEVMDASCAQNSTTVAITASGYYAAP